jgi:hypothetical protein
MAWEEQALVKDRGLLRKEVGGRGLGNETEMCLLSCAGSPVGVSAEVTGRVLLLISRAWTVTFKGLVMHAYKSRVGWSHCILILACHMSW